MKNIYSRHTKFLTLLLKINGNKYEEFVRETPLSNDHVTNRISEIDKDQLVQLITRIKESP